VTLPILPVPPDKGMYGKAFSTINKSALFHCPLFGNRGAAGSGMFPACKGMHNLTVEALL
jgi:hypothetical protein